MKKTAFFFILAALLASSCTKTSTPAPSNRASFTWTYAGATYTADTVLAANSNQVASYYEIYAQTGPWSTPGTIFSAKLTSFSSGEYSDGQNRFTETVSGVGSYTIAPFSLMITSSSSSSLSGTFTGSLNGQTITGAFANVPIVR